MVGAGVFLLSACAPIQLVSKYDDQTDQAATAMQKDISAFFVKMQTVVVPAEGSFAANQDFYRKQAVAIGAMQLRAGAIPKNGLTAELLQLVEDNLAYLALLHKGCISGALTDPQKAAVHEMGIDASLDCRTAYGASADAVGRGDSTLKLALTPTTQAAIDTELTSVIRLEIAKKRGEK
jgi:hypothetical protein